MTEPIFCTLAENALDYLLLAGEQAKDGSPRMLKHSLATLADGVELLLKARLDITDWSLIFKDVAKASRSNYESGDFQSVFFDEAVKRLEKRCSVVIANSHLAIINELRQLRNRIRHFAVTTENDAAISLIVKTFSFAIAFVTDHLQPVHEAIEDELNKLRALLGEFEEFVDARMAEIQSDLDSAFRVVQCPVCLQDALSLGEEDVTCLFCGHKTDGESAASQWVDRFFGFQSLKDSLIEPQIEQCPECGAEACVDMGAETDGRLDYVCFACGEEGDYQHCSECGQLTGDDNPGEICNDCWEDVLRRND
jgi:hypothetical protein